MEWVETTGKTIAEALEAALDRLGVAESDAEIVVLEEPRNAMFGLRRSNARIRARVRPVQARAKRPSRRTSNGGSAEGRPRRPAGGPGGRAKSAGDDASVGSAREGGSRSRTSGGQPARNRGRGSAGRREPAKPGADDGGRSRSRSRSEAAQRNRPAVTEEDRPIRATGAPKEEEMSIEAQAELAETFVRGVVHGFGVDATVESSIDDDVIQVRVVGEGLGLLVGPRGATVDALQELTRTAVQHRSDEHAGRIHVDVAGYRARRAAALKDFARRVAEEVVASGQAQALEPMNAVDRKAVHDAVSEIPAAATSSEGEDPRRYVVIRPAAQATPGQADPDDAGDEEDDVDTE